MPTTVELFVDPVCPFTWIARRWLDEVAALRSIDLRLRVMSLGILNDDPADPFEASRGLDSAWRPVRVAAALVAERGDAAMDPFFADFGQRFHVDHVRGRDRAIRETLAALAADHLYPAADDHAWDAAVRASHEDAMRDVGAGVGTPIVRIDGRPVFGPVLTSVPRGEAAVTIFDAVAALVARPEFAELKRGVTGGIELT